MCTTTYGHATADAVVLASTAGVHLWNATHDKCASFSNSVMSPLTLSVTGSWSDNYGGKYMITPTNYYSGSSVSTIIGHGPGFMVLEQGTGTYNPGSFQKIEWTWDATCVRQCRARDGCALGRCPRRPLPPQQPSRGRR